MADSSKIETNIEKIAKNRFPNVSRARSKSANAIAKVMKKAALIAELLTENDQLENLRVIREAKKATYRWYNPETKKAELIPDTKARLAGAVLDLAYREGKPVERSHVVTENLGNRTLLEAQLIASPKMMEALQKTLDDARAKVAENGGSVLSSVLTLEAECEAVKGESDAGEES
jgi:hypothetical protein